MEETKTDKRTKEFKSQQTDKTQFDILKESGMPIKMAMFKSAVKFLQDTPQTEYHDPSTAVNTPSTLQRAKQAKMWFTPHGLLCERLNQRMIVPLSNVGYSIAL